VKANVFCNKCGERLKQPEGYPKQVGFYRHSGKPKEITFLVCPNRKWYNGHDKLKFITNPREFAAPYELYRPDWVQSD